MLHIQVGQLAEHVRHLAAQPALPDDISPFLDRTSQAAAAVLVVANRLGRLTGAIEPRGDVPDVRLFGPTNAPH